MRPSRRQLTFLTIGVSVLVACSGDSSNPEGTATSVSGGKPGGVPQGTGVMGTTGPISAVATGAGGADVGNSGSGGASTGSGGSPSSTVGNGGMGGHDTAGAGGSGNADGGPAAGGTSSDAGMITDANSAVCTYKDDATFCACKGWNCGGTTVEDAAGAVHTVYCGACGGTQYCQSTAASGIGVGTCGGNDPIVYAWQRQKIDMLVGMGENDNTAVNYDYAQNIQDGRGYTIGKVGFCSGTGDFVIVADCYNNLKPGNVLSKYWGHPNPAGISPDGLVHYENLFFTTMMNQGDTSLIDSLKGTSTFVKDCATAANDVEYRTCQDSMADALYMSTALQHAAEHGLKGAMTIGFLYDTELNFGDEDESNSVLGTKSVMKKADADYGSGLPTDFTGKPWEESRWLGFLIKERTIVMSGDATWREDMDQNATWEAARRLHTGKTNNPESGTDLSMNYDLVSQYKAGSATAGVPCWPTGLKATTDSQSSIFIVSIDKSSSASDQTSWKATGKPGTGAYAACPTNPTP